MLIINDHRPFQSTVIHKSYLWNGLGASRANLREAKVSVPLLQGLSDLNLMQSFQLFLWELLGNIKAKEKLRPITILTLNLQFTAHLPQDLVAYG